VAALQQGFIKSKFYHYKTMSIMQNFEIIEVRIAPKETESPPAFSLKDNLFLNAVAVWVVRCMSLAGAFCVLGYVVEFTIGVLDETVNKTLEFMPKVLEALKVSFLSACVFFGIYAVYKVWWIGRQI
jgi:fructose-specific phosphotransferase system IIC component